MQQKYPLDVQIGCGPMELDTIKQIIQDFFQENTLTVVGSGLSVAEGIPGMSALSNELQSKIPNLLSDPIDIRCWDEIKNNLLAGVGLEQALHNTKPSPHIEDNIRTITANFIGDAEKKVLYKIVNEGKILRFVEYIRRFTIRNDGLVVVTTNYDRLIEYACEYNGIRIDTLFVGRFLAHFASKRSKYAFCEGFTNLPGKQKRAVFAPKVTVLKPHGCLSWHMINGVPYSIPNYPLDDCLIITPGVNKYKEGYSVPFDTHRTEANAAIDRAQRYIIIGYGFGDGHLETHLIQQLNAGKPALLLTHSLSSSALELTRKCKHITAICSDGSDGSKIVTATSETLISHINLWDLKSMLKEVF